MVFNRETIKRTVGNLKVSSYNKKYSLSQVWFVSPSLYNYSDAAEAVCQLFSSGPVEDDTFSNLPEGS